MSEQEKPLIEEEVLFPDFDVSIDSEETTVETEETEIEEEVTVEVKPEKDEVAVGLYETLSEKNIIFPTEDEFDGTWDSLEKYIEEIPSKVTESIIEESPEAIKQLLEYGFNKDNVSFEDLKEFFNLQVQDAENNNFNFDDIEVAKSFLAKDMKSLDYEQDIIDAAIDAMDDRGEDYIKNKAKALHQKNQTNLAQQKLKESKTSKLQRETQIQEYYTNINKELDTLNYKDNRRKEILHNLDSRIVSQKNKVISKSPKALIQLADFYSYFDEKTGEFNLEKFTKNSDSKKIEKIKNNLFRDKFTSKGLSKGSKNKNPNDMGDELKPVF